MPKSGYSRNTPLGRVNHYDSSGKKVGQSRRGLLDNTWVHYDENGKRIGVTRDSLIGGTYTTDTHGRTIGYSRKNLVGGTNYYDTHGKLIGRSRDNLVGGSRDSDGFANQTSTRPAERISYRITEDLDEVQDYSDKSTAGSKSAYIVTVVILIVIAVFVFLCIKG